LVHHEKLGVFMRPLFPGLHAWILNRTMEADRSF
jgi:hypothetical protein